MNPQLIRLSKSCISEAEKKAVLNVLDKEFLGMGQEVKLFENALTNFFSRSTVCVVNGTAAIHLALQSCGIGPGDEVIVPSLTYISTFQAISATGAKPVACDIDESTLTINFLDAEFRITSRTRAIIPVHYGGRVGDLNEIYNLAQKKELRVIEDAAHAFGTRSNGKLVGSFGDIACFSFDGIKNITSGEGGCITSDDNLVLDRLRDARLLGVENDTQKRFLGERSWEFDVRCQGWRYHMSNIMAAIGLEQLNRFELLASIRQTRAKQYNELLKNHSCIQIFNNNHDEVVPHIYVIRIHGLKNRKELQNKLLQRNIQTGIHYQPNHLLSFYRDLKAAPLPITEKIFPELLTLPLHPDLSENDIEYVFKNLIELI